MSEGSTGCDAKRSACDMTGSIKTSDWRRVRVTPATQAAPQSDPRSPSAADTR